MERVTIDGTPIEYEVRGDGEPVVLIHAGLVADFFAPLMGRPELDGYRLIRYHRAGYADSGTVDIVDVGQYAAHCLALMGHLGVDRAHVVGHSSSANMAIQLALDAPAAVRSLALLEMALLAVPSASFAAEAIGQYRSGDRRTAVDTWMRGACGPDYRRHLDHALPGAFDRAVADADTFFGQELPALRAWSFGQDEARHVTQPALVVLGARSNEVNTTFAQRNELLLAWLPDAEPFVLPDATHLLQVEQPGAMARGLASFLARHPIKPTAQRHRGAMSG
jgi:pimeloyl-ACP methyl ester carboxylesterase